MVNSKARQQLKKWLEGPPRRSQDELAERLGMAQQTISKWLVGRSRPPTDQIKRLLEAATEGAVVADDWLTVKEKRQREQFEERLRGLTSKTASAA